MDTSIPKDFADHTSLDADRLASSTRGRDDLEAFVDLIHVSAILEKALADSVHPGLFATSPFLTEMSRINRKPSSDEAMLVETSGMLTKWKE